jgi:hypothetical protein
VPLGVPARRVLVGGVGVFFVRVNQVLVRRWTCLVAMSDRLARLPRRKRVARDQVRFKDVRVRSGRLGDAHVARGAGRGERALLCAELRCVARYGGVGSIGHECLVWMAPVHGGR